MKLKYSLMFALVLIHVSGAVLADSISENSLFTVDEMYKLISDQRKELLIAEHNAKISKLETSTSQLNSDIKGPESEMTNFLMGRPTVSGISPDRAANQSQEANMTLIEIDDNKAHIAFSGQLKQVMEGDVVNGYKVSSISSDAIHLVFDGETTVLKIEW